MLIEEMLDKRDFADSVTISLRNQIGKDKCKVFMMDEFEIRDTDSFLKFIDENIEKINKHIFVFVGWAFVKSVYKKTVSFIEEINDNDKYYTLFLPELITLIITDSKEALLNDVIKKIKKEVLAVSSLNIIDMEDSDNAVQINYSNKSVVKYFEERPKSVEEIIDSRK